MLSRVADSVYWMNRYIERAENYCRFIDVNFQLSLDLPGTNNQWEPLVFTTGDNELFQKNYPDGPTRENVIQFLAFDRENPSSILSSFAAARENARQIRENISTEMWQILNDTYLKASRIQHASEFEGLEDLHDFLTELRHTCLLFYGCTDATFSHDELWHFGLLGRFLERADKTTRILDMKYFILLPSLDDVGGAMDLLQWLSLLKSAGAHEMFNRLYKRITPEKIAEFLILNESFPRSIRYCLTRADNTLRAISGTRTGTFSNEAEKTLGPLLAELNFTSVREIFNHGMHEYLDHIQLKLNTVGSSIIERYFNY